MNIFALISEYETQAALDIARMKAGELDGDDARDLIENHFWDYAQRAQGFGFIGRGLARWKLRLVRDRVHRCLPTLAAIPLPDAKAELEKLRA